ncbi:type I-E CRISPR-associated protein Cse2/CasB [Rhodovibrio sodomensis]|uniref:Type I-E CRISPR-associated protein Cse2/CasB n=1 Tax=Rhodovibrio sodomensis TaxID=1088 RepID=A0ABS1DHU7_9PROT|nr:type I-E CRISPR-associated protein Cse2/CasB [Rhodovibrio sodomensis]MBK1669502.1 type I-E CRISPR-associated protein Cse2/CasB [Rhodovibrio sodomensis]
MSTTVRPPRFAWRLDRANRNIPDAGHRLLSWHRTLTGEPDDPNKRSAPDRALRAQLKRCQDPGDALFLPGFAAVFQYLYPDESSRTAALRDQEVVAALARVAITAASLGGRGAQIDTATPLALQMLGPEGRIADGRVEDATVTPLRLRSLLATDDPDPALARWRRLLPVFAGNGVNLPELAQALAHWDETTRRTLSFAYFAFAATGPHRSGTPTTTEPDDDTASLPADA